MDRFHVLHPSMEKLYSLYHYAICFVYPSLYEGFGLPTLEAMACGCPTLISDTSCFPEIGGDVSFYFHTDNNGKSNISEQLESIYDMGQEERDTICSKGIERANTFSWENTAKQYAKVYKSLV